MEKKQINFIVQASSRSWSGGKDLCMNFVDGFPAIYWTLKKIINNFPNSKIVVAAPYFDKDGDLNNVIKNFTGKVRIFYGHSCNPMLRLIETYNKFLSGNYFIRLNGLNMCFIPHDIKNIYKITTGKHLDCCKFPDDYPSQLTADVYNINALKRASELIDEDSPYSVHPKYYMFESNKFNTAFFNDMDKVTDKYLQYCRKIGRQIYIEKRIEVNDKKIETGDQITFHYRLATKYIDRNDVVLDIACGDGCGLSILARYARYVYGGDISQKFIAIAKEKYKNINNIKVSIQDVANMTFENDTFDVVTSFETMEHVEIESYFKEIYRVLKHSGKLILSTPQNSLGYIPINPEHNYEYSLKEICNIVSKYFKIQKVIGIKQGCIINENSKGSNTFAVLVK